MQNFLIHIYSFQEPAENNKSDDQAANKTLFPRILFQREVTPEAAVRRCSWEKVFQKYAANSSDAVLPPRKRYDLETKSQKKNVETFNTFIGYAVSFTYILSTCFKGAISGLRQFLATESLLKMMKNVFYFKLFSFSRYLSFVLTFWTCIKTT